MASEVQSVSLLQAPSSARRNSTSGEYSQEQRAVPPSPSRWHRGISQRQDISAYLIPSPQSTSYAATKGQKVQLRSQKLLASPIPTHRRKALSPEQHTCNNRILITISQLTHGLELANQEKQTEVRGYCLYQGPAHKAGVWLREMQATVTTPRSGAVAEVFPRERGHTKRRTDFI